MALRLHTSLSSAGRALTAAAVLCLGVLAAAAPLPAQTAATRTTVPATPAAPKPPAPEMPQVSGTPLDQVDAIVNGTLVLDSDVNEERRFETIQPYRETSGAVTRERTIERLINRALILQQAKLQPEDELTDADVQKDLDSLRRTIPECAAAHCDTDAGWSRYLAERGFTPAQMQVRWKQRMEVLRFIEDRFRFGIKINDTDVKSYYEKTLVPQFREKGVAAPKLAEVSDRIHEVLLQQQVSNLLRDWLRSLRAQGSVVVLHPGEDAP